MNSDKKQKPEVELTQPNRRSFLGKSALLGLTGAGLSLGLTACKDKAPATTPAAPAGSAKASASGSHEVAPGQLDEYYAFISAGHAGEARILGLPSGRTLKRIPVFNIDCMVGWGITNESKAIIGTKPDGSLKYTTGDTHHVHGSYKDGTYDGRWLFVNDKIHSPPGAHPHGYDGMRQDYRNCRTSWASTAFSPTSATRSMRKSITPPACSAAPSSISRCRTTAATWKIQANGAACSPASMPARWKSCGNAASTAIWIWWPHPMTASWPRRTSTTPKTPPI